MILPDRVPRVERVVRVLEDHLRLAPDRRELLARELGDLEAIELDRAAGWADEHQDRASRGRLAGAGLTHETKRLARVDREVDAVDGLDVADRARQQAARPDREVRLEVDRADDRALAVPRATLALVLVAADRLSSSWCLHRPCRQRGQNLVRDALPRLRRQVTAYEMVGIFGRRQQVRPHRLSTDRCVIGRSDSAARRRSPWAAGSATAGCPGSGTSRSPASTSMRGIDDSSPSV